MKIRVVVAVDSEIRSADDFQVIGQAGMRDGEVIGGQVRGLRVGIDEGSILISDHFVEVVFHQQ